MPAAPWATRTPAPVSERSLPRRGDGGVLPVAEIPVDGGDLGAVPEESVGFVRNQRVGAPVTGQRGIMRSIENRRDSAPRRQRMSISTPSRSDGTGGPRDVWTAP